MKYDDDVPNYAFTPHGLTCFSGPDGRGTIRTYPFESILPLDLNTPMGTYDLYTGIIEPITKDDEELTQ